MKCKLEQLKQELKYYEERDEFNPEINIKFEQSAVIITIIDKINEIIENINNES